MNIRLSALDTIRLFFSKRLHDRRYPRYLRRFPGINRAKVRALRAKEHMNTYTVKNRHKDTGWWNRCKRVSRVPVAA